MLFNTLTKQLDAIEETIYLNELSFLAAHSKVEGDLVGLSFNANSIIFLVLDYASGATIKHHIDWNTFSLWTLSLKAQ